jgi:metallophosphoesterase superfamily enzyme
MNNRLVAAYLMLADIHLGHDVGAGCSGLNLVLLRKLVTTLIADSRCEI